MCPLLSTVIKSVSSKCGSADLLEALGVGIEIPVCLTEKILEEIGLYFMFVPKYHSSTKYAAPLRREIRIHTIFNIFGLLASPANAEYLLVGVYDEKLLKPLDSVLSNLGMKSAKGIAMVRILGN